MNTKIKILLDTDIGDDIDDALTLALALRMPEVELVGVTTVFGDTDIRAREAARILDCAQVCCPVYAGMSGSAGVTRGGFSQYEPALDDPEYAPVNCAAKDGGAAAVRFIVDCACRYGRELTVVGVGPLTNLAAAIRLDPSAMRSVGKAALMGGAFYRTISEWNILCDAPAAETVLESGLPIECCGVDVTMQTALNGCQYNRIIRYEGENELLRYLARLTRMWHDCTGNLPILHDPLTLYNAVRPGTVFMEEQGIKVLTDGECKGITLNRDRSTVYFGDKLDIPRIRVGKAVNERDFFEDFFKTLYREDL